MRRASGFVLDAPLARRRCQAVPAGSPGAGRPLAGCGVRGADRAGHRPPCALAVWPCVRRTSCSPLHLCSAVLDWLVDYDAFSLIVGPRFFPRVDSPDLSHRSGAVPCPWMRGARLRLVELSNRGALAHPSAPLRMSDFSSLPPFDACWGAGDSFSRNAIASHHALCWMAPARVVG
jgi:hypothetical protein